VCVHARTLMCVCVCKDTDVCVCEDTDVCVCVRGH